MIDWLNDGWFWSYGSHPEFKYECRVWRRIKFPKVEIYIGIGNTLEIAIQNCRNKYEQRNSY